MLPRTTPRWTEAKKPIFDKIGDDFVTYFHEYVRAADLRSEWQWICFTPMSEFVCREDTPCMDFVGRAETFSQDLDLLGRRLGLNIEKSEDRNVRTSLCDAKLKYLDRFDRATIAAINEIYEQDFHLFNYQILDPASFPRRLR